MNYNQPEQNIQGWMSQEELQWLFDKAQEMDKIVEVGSWKGRSTHALLSGCKGIVYAVDHFLGSPSERDGAHADAKTQDIYAIFKENVGHFLNLIVMKMDSIEASMKFRDKEIEMVFLDGDHEKEAFKRDMEAWMPKCSRLLCGHDRDQEGIPGVLKELSLTYKKEVGAIWSIEL